MFTECRADASGLVPPATGASNRKRGGQLSLGARGRRPNARPHRHRDLAGRVPRRPDRPFRQRRRRRDDRARLRAHVAPRRRDARAVPPPACCGGHVGIARRSSPGRRHGRFVSADAARGRERDAPGRRGYAADARGHRAVSRRATARKRRPVVIALAHTSEVAAALRTLAAGGCACDRSSRRRSR